MKDTITQRVDSHTHVPQERLKLYPPFPTAVKIEVTSRCNSKCNHCAVRRNLREMGDMDPDFLHRILGEFKDLGVKEIGLFLLGESFILPRLPEYVAWVKKEYKFDYCFITSNGIAATPEMLTAVIDAGLDSLKFSVNAPDRDRYLQMNGVDEFNNVVSHIKWLGERKKAMGLKIRTAMSSILNPDWKDEFEEFHAEMRQYVDETYYLPFYNMAGHVTGGTQTGNIGRVENPSAVVPCWVLFNASKVTWDGWLTACYSDHDERFKLGNLKEDTVLSCWYSKKATDLRRAHLTNSFTKDCGCAACLGVS